MSDTVKLIVDIPVRILDTIQADQMISREQLAVLQTHIQNGIPLDDVRAEIDEQYDRVRPYNIDVAQGLEMALEILNKYDPESEEE